MSGDHQRPLGAALLQLPAEVPPLFPSPPPASCPDLRRAACTDLPTVRADKLVLCICGTGEASKASTLSTELTDLPRSSPVTSAIYIYTSIYIYIYIHAYIYGSSKASKASTLSTELTLAGRELLKRRAHFFGYFRALATHLLQLDTRVVIRTPI